jgi:hypothetical protein
VAFSISSSELDAWRRTQVRSASVNSPMGTSSAAADPQAYSSMILGSSRVRLRSGGAMIGAGATRSELLLSCLLTQTIMWTSACGSHMRSITTANQQARVARGGRQPRCKMLRPACAPYGAILSARRVAS